SAGGKLRQAAAALWLEARYSKRELLEAYINLVPFGGNIRGTGVASRIYFGRPPSQLTPGEALTLAVIPQHPLTRAGRTIHGSALEQARARLVKQWSAQRGIVDLPADTGVQFALPQLAPHFVDALLGERADRSGRVETTLDSGLQRVLERQIQRYLAQY